MIGMCPTNMKFNETLGQCILPANKPHDTIRIYDESENCDVMIPNCNKDGKFPVPSNCSFYYDCQRNNHNYLQYVYKCPYETMYHPDLHRCVTMTKCYVDHYDILDRFDYDYFPKCIVQGQFRTSRHCNLFYRCIPNMDGSFFQIRYECPPMMYYDIEKERCYMGYYTNCEYMPWDKIVKDYVFKHNLKIDNCIPKHTTAISTLNTTITTSSCSSTTEISINSTNTYPTTQTTDSTVSPYTVSSTSGIATDTESTTSDETEVTDSTENSSVTEPESSTTPYTEATDSQETETDTDTTISQTDERTITNEFSTTPDTRTETTDDHTSVTDTSSTGESETVTMESSDTTTGHSSNETSTSISTITEEISTAITTETATSDTTKMKSYSITSTSETKLPTETTQATSGNTKTDTSTSLTSKQTSGSTTKVPYTSKQPTTVNTYETSSKTYTSAPITSKQTTGSTTNVSYTSQQPTTGNTNGTSTKTYTTTPITSKQATGSTTNVSYTSQQPTTGNTNEITTKTYTTTPITSKQVTGSTTTIFYTSQQPTTGNTNETSTKTYTTTRITSKQTTESSTAVSSTSQQPTTSTKYSTRTSKDSSSEEYDSYEEFTWDDVAWNRHHRTSKIPYGHPTPSTKKPRAHFHPNPPPFDYPDSNYWDDSHSHESAKSSTSVKYSSTTYPLSSHAGDPDTSESNESNSRPVRCYNNRQGGLTCDGVKGKPGGWFELPGYLLRYRKRSGEDEAPNKKMNGELNLRLRYPNTYKLEAYPKQKRRVEKPDGH
ncbi:uncharacterized protein LOC135700957 [Ochlerotatus camptorhynchus]|uniref:uncharacterized protein LOC135700957 n=1 Tax=Ochlerotatus camptorhynchus TaxID=644619 RepID=UPI0031D85776